AGRRREPDQDQRPAVPDRRVGTRDREVLRPHPGQRGGRGCGQSGAIARAAVGLRRWIVEGIEAVNVHKVALALISTALAFVGGAFVADYAGEATDSIWIAAGVGVLAL